jgi:2-amino-4-hydroxy-6-hydroxymethyldihydropteridine diphosphokinase
MGAPLPAGEAVSGEIAFIGMGANMGEPTGACRDALKSLAEVSGVTLLRSSALYRTEPVGPQDQAWFINAVAEIRTTLSPDLLLIALKDIERRMGRSEGVRWGPRLIDLDLLLYGQRVFRNAGLQIPHPELHLRRFVLVPLCELASYVIHPAFGVSICGLLDRLADTSRVELAEPVNPF